MAGRIVPGSPKFLDICGFGSKSTALRSGATLLAAGWIALQAGFAGASDDRRSVLAALSAALDPARAAGGKAPLVEIPIAPAVSTRREKGAVGSAAIPAPRRPVCVRLCDGFFFPAASFSGSDEVASCAGLCPDAPAALYFMRRGSDRIEDAVSTSGERYAALPVSLRYRTTRDGACACHRAVAQNPPYWRDPTLRAGDAVMTPDGLAVFRGAGPSPYGRDDFTDLAAAPLPDDRRARLTAIERAGPLPTREADRPEIAEAARLKAKSGGADEIRFAPSPVAATN